MGKRLERYHEIKKEKKKEREKVLIFSFSLIFLVSGLIIVDNSLRKMMCVENKGLFDYLRVEGKYNVKLIGKSFCVDVEGIKIFLEGKANVFIDELSKIYNIVRGTLNKVIN